MIFVNEICLAAWFHVWRLKDSLISPQTVPRSVGSYRGELSLPPKVIQKSPAFTSLELV